MMPYENLLCKYDISKDELRTGIDVLATNIGKIANSQVLCAVMDLLSAGDITAVQKENRPESGHSLKAANEINL